MTSIAPAPSEKQSSTKQAPRKTPSSSSSSSRHNRGTEEPNIEQQQHYDQDKLLQSITSRQSALLSPSLTLTMYIPTASVGAVIGRQGKNIANLQKVASQAASTLQTVRVSVLSNHPESTNANETSSLPFTYSELDFSNPDWTPVVIRADPKAAFTAAIKLHDNIGGGTTNYIDQVVVDVPLARSKHAAVVGKRGMMLANISADTHVRIFVPHKELRHDIIQLEGDLPNVIQCLDKILQQVYNLFHPKAGGKTTALQQPSRALDGSDQPPPPPPPYTQTLVMQHLASQTKLRSIRRKTDTQIKVKKQQQQQQQVADAETDNDNSTAPSWQVTVTGKQEENVQEAVAILQKWNTMKNNSAAAAAASSSDGAAPSSSTSAGTAATTTSRSRRGRGLGGGGRNNNNNNNRGPSRSHSRGDKPQSHQQPDEEPSSGGDAPSSA